MAYGVISLKYNSIIQNVNEFSVGVSHSDSAQRKGARALRTCLDTGSQPSCQGPVRCCSRAAPTDRAEPLSPSAREGLRHAFHGTSPWKSAPACFGLRHTHCPTPSPLSCSLPMRTRLMAVTSSPTMAHMRRICRCLWSKRAGGPHISARAQGQSSHSHTRNYDHASA